MWFSISAAAADCLASWRCAPARARFCSSKKARLSRSRGKTVADAGFADKAEFFQANSFELTLPERADVVICDHVGYFGFDYGILELLADAKQRFLKPGGIIIPAQDRAQARAGRV